MFKYYTKYGGYYGKDEIQKARENNYSRNDIILTTINIKTV